jgi:DNA topoisomerase-2
VQEFRKNMSEKDEPTITKAKKSETPYTCITYYPDFEKFHMAGMTDDDVAWMKRRAFDIAACTKKDIKVYINNEEIPIKTFDDYIKMHYDDEPFLVYNEVNNRWKIGCAFVPDKGNNQISFVNGTSTYKGGTHIDYVMDQIVSTIAAHIKTKEKLTVKSNLIKEHLDIFINADIVNPSFSSQTKSELTSKPSKYGSVCQVPKNFTDALIKTKLIELVVKNAQFKEATSLNKTDGKKLSMVNIPKLEDARWAGTKKAHECRLFLTEGDSAFSYFKAGLAHIGKDKYGGFPLRGKLLNVRNATVDQIKNNEEFIRLKQIMGLKQDEKYNDTSRLRYGGIIILTDADADGSHIKGLIINLFQYFWPELLKQHRFIGTMVTPIIRVWKKTDKAKKDPIEFVSEIKFIEWEKTVDIKKYDVKYYKGLGTSDDKTAKKSFVDFDKRVTWFVWDEVAQELKEEKKEIKKKEKSEKQSEKNSDSENDSDSDSDSDSESNNGDNGETENNAKGGAIKATKKKGKKGKLEINITDPQILNSKSYDRITLAFDETRADDRKKWLTKYDKYNIIDYANQNISYSEFIDKDLIHFSNYDNIRSIPSLVDGFKPSQRKIMYVCLEDNIKKDIKVIDLASEVSKRTAYKHGNTSLEETIIGMAQDFTGTNNINLLYPNGNFGHRWIGGKDSASPRYIFTFLEHITQKIFLREDNSILNLLQEDGKEVEPETFYPIIPMVLVNGASGIGTGFATAIPQYNPLDIIDNILRLMSGIDPVEMVPWYNGYKGVIEEEKDEKTKKTCFRATGTYVTKDGNTLTITELPVGSNKCLFPRDYEEKIICPLAGLAYNSKEDKKDQGKKKKKVLVKKKINEEDEILSKYFNNCGLNDVNFELYFKGNEMTKICKKGMVIDKLKLSSTISTSNMYLYNTKNVLTKYDSPLDIITEFFEYRLGIYVKRKAHHMKLLNNELQILKYKVMYIRDVLDDKIKVAKKKREEVIEQLIKKGYPKLSRKVDATEEEKSYEYLAGMLLWSLTQEKIDELEKEYEEKKKEYDDYNSITEIELWKRELLDFKEAYKLWLLEKKERNEDDEGDKKKKKK